MFKTFHQNKRLQYQYTRRIFRLICHSQVMISIQFTNKKCEGFDRIPVCVLKDCKDLLLDPLSDLLNKIHITSVIPEQWKVSKIIPIFKKGNKHEIENYRPIANLCSASKIFEKLILKQIHYLESTNKLDLTGKQQHGFKKSTATAGVLLQSIISRMMYSCYHLI